MGGHPGGFRRFLILSRQVVAAWLSADYILYTHFLARHERTAAKVKKLKEKVSRLQLLGSQLESTCEGERKKEQEECRPFFRKEREYTRLLQMRNRHLVKESLGVVDSRRAQETFDQSIIY